MTLRSRRWIMLTLTALFVISGPLIIFYASGWRFNFSTYKIERVGAIFLPSKNSDITIRLGNRTIENKISEFSKGILIDNLTPKTYYLEVSRPGFQSWSKYLTVEPAIVTESQPIILLPEKIDFIPIRGGVADLDFQNGFLIWQESGGHFFLTNPANLASSLNLTLLFNHLKEKQLGLPGQTRISQVVVQDANQFLVKSGKSWYQLDTKKLALQRYPKSPPPPEIILIAPDQTKTATTSLRGLEIQKTGGVVAVINLPDIRLIRKLAWHKNSAHILIQYQDSLFLTETDVRSNVNQQLIQDSLKKWAYDTDQNRVYLLTKTGELAYWDLPE